MRIEFDTSQCDFIWHRVKQDDESKKAMKKTEDEVTKIYSVVYPVKNLLTIP